MVVADDPSGADQLKGATEADDPKETGRRRGGGGSAHQQQERTGS